MLKVNKSNKDSSIATFGEPFAMIQVGKQLRANDLSFCFRFQIHGRFGKHIGLSSDKEITDFAVWFRFQDDYGFLLLDSQALIFGIPKGIMKPYNWYNFCSSVNQTHYSIVADGKVWFQGKAKAEIKNKIPLENLVVVGSGINGEWRER